MAATESKMIALGTKAPNFNLIEPKTGITKSYQELRSDTATVVMFICNHCPFVIHINKTLSALAKDFTRKGVSFIGINSNDIENYPADSPEKMIETAEREDYIFPYLFDATQDIAKAYGAACTPDFFVYNYENKLVYRGQFDDSRPSNGKEVTGNDLRAALDEILETGTTTIEQVPSIGCNIKWKATK